MTRLGTAFQRARGAWPLALAAALPVLLLLPFLGKAVHMDDPLFVWTARQILIDPLDFYGFTVNWYGTPQPMYEVTQNPPLQGYYLALLSALFGGTGYRGELAWSEIGLHAGMLLPAALAGAAAFLVARRFVRNALAAALCVVCAPAFLVCATSLMCDVPMLALWLWAVHFWLAGMEKKSPARLLAAGVLVAACALTKYFGAALIPLLLAYTLIAGKGTRRYVFFLVVPVLLLAGYEVWTAHLYGEGLISAAGRYARSVNDDYGVDYPRRLLTTLTFTGGGLAFPLFLVPWARGSRKGTCLAGAGCLAAAAALLGVHLLRGTDPAPEMPMWAYGAQVLLWATVGAGVVLLSLNAIRRDRSAATWLLCFWIWGTLFFSVALNHFVSARILLPLLLPVAILLIRNIESCCAERFPKPARMAIVLCAVIALLAAWADTVHANTARQAAEEAGFDWRPTHGRYGSTFAGHWGFQFYMEKYEDNPLDLTEPGLREHERVIIPENNSNLVEFAPQMIASQEIHEFPSFPLLSVMHLRSGAGFHSDVWGILPFVFWYSPPERYADVTVGPPRAGTP